MKAIITVSEWLLGRTDTDFVELSNDPVKNQLGRLDNAGTGIGFVFVLVPMQVDGSDKVELNMTSCATFKIRGQWLVAVDENISDIAGALVRMVTTNIQ